MIKNIEILFPEIKLTDLGRRPTGINDIASLFYLIDKYSKDNILEIGTWYGKTTYELAKRYPKKTIYTMDYMDEYFHLDPEKNRGLAKQKEDLCKYAKDLENVKFIFADSEFYDFNKFKKVDFIFIDGNHEFNGIFYDTCKAIAYYLNRPEKINKIIAWHDIRVGHTDVPKFMKALSQIIDIFFINNANIGYTIII